MKVWKRFPDDGWPPLDKNVIVHDGRREFRAPGRMQTYHGHLHWYGLGVGHVCANGTLWVEMPTEERRPCAPCEEDAAYVRRREDLTKRLFRVANANLNIEALEKIVAVADVEMPQAYP